MKKIKGHNKIVEDTNIAKTKSHVGKSSVLK
jgi:hypothetical protein